ncbi:MAG: Mu-like prophage major head subunit gpT family protein [Pseudonocardia sp.]|nr:Mu-like prophage major head subunit gpT family protein [Pseudonocardia sp.]
MEEDEIQAGENATRNAAGAPAAAAQTAAAPVIDADAIRAEERARSAEIGSICARHGLDAAFRDQLIRDGVTLDRARAMVLERLVETDPAGRTAEPAPAQARGGDARGVQYRDAVTAALMHRSDPGLHQLSTDAREFRGLSLLEMARAVLERGGVSTRGMSRMELAGVAFTSRAGVGYHATGDFPAILANVAGKTLRAAYASTPRSFAAWARRATITDFKPVTRVQLGGAPDLEKVLESGEFQYGTIGEAKEVYALASYGRIIAITRQALINDDLDAFTRIPAAFGASAADLESDIVYSILMQNPAMGDGTALFHADHGNLGATEVINEKSLSAAYRAFAEQKGIEGRKISILPAHILVPPGPRSLEARKQITATTPTSTADVNTFAGRLQVVEEPRLIPSAGQDPWFLVADPARIDTVEYAYLDGQEGVFTETRMGFEVDGMEIKARHDFAAKAIDWRGLWKNPGKAPV